MGGQACIIYGAAEFSRDLALLVLADPANLILLRRALEALDAVCIAVPPFEEEFLARGHAIHFRCRREVVAGLRIDVMSRLRGVDDFDLLWARRISITADDADIDILSLPDLVQTKKTQRDKDWPMIRRLLEQDYFSLPPEPEAGLIEFLLRELRTPELLHALALKHPQAAGVVAPVRRAVLHALSGTRAEVEAAMLREEALERENDRAYWTPLKQELEHLRRSRKALSG